MAMFVLSGDELRDSQIHRSVCYAYSVLILAFIVRYSENVQWLEIYGPKLLYFVEHGKALELLFCFCKFC